VTRKKNIIFGFFDLLPECGFAQVPLASKSLPKKHDYKKIFSNNNFIRKKASHFCLWRFIIFCSIGPYPHEIFLLE